MSNTPTQADHHFSNMIINAVAERMKPEFIEKAVLERVDKLVVSAVDDALRSYSDTGKTITKAVENALQVKDLNLPSYGETVTQILRHQIEQNVSELVSARLTEDMADLLKLAPREIKLSEIVEAMCLPHKEEGSYGDVVTCIVEATDYGSTWIYLDEDDADKSKYDCQHNMLLRRDGTIASATVTNRELKARSHMGVSFGIAQQIRAFYACKTIITIDEDAVITSVGDY